MIILLEAEYSDDTLMVLILTPILVLSTLYKTKKHFCGTEHSMGVFGKTTQFEC